MITLLAEFWESLRIALRALRVQKMRSALTTLGIVIGVVSVTLMATVVNGLEKQFEEDMATLGADVLYVEKWPWGMVRDWWNYINRPNITADLAEIIAEKSRFAVAAVPVASTMRGSASYGSQTLSGVQTLGATSEYPFVHQFGLESGRFFSEVEGRGGRRVCVIGARVAEEMFVVGDPIGKRLRIGGTRYEVVGVFEKKGETADQTGSADLQIVIPFDAFKRQFGMERRDVSVRVRIADGADLADAKSEITGVLRVARRLDAKDPNDFEINEQQSLREQLAPVKATIYAIGIGLTALSLLVGGIGVMNIMFVSVKERTREIGIRKAVGAPARSILTQFLVEAVIVCLIGGAIGVLLALPLGFGIRMLLPSTLDFAMVGLAFGMCVVIGIIFGLAPAWTAATEEPIEALRYE